MVLQSPDTKAVEQDQQEHKCPNERHHCAEDGKHQRLQRRTVSKEAHDSDRTLVQRLGHIIKAHLLMVYSDLKGFA